MKVAAIQLNSQDEVIRNSQKVQQYLAEVAALGVELALLPENFIFFGNEQEKVQRAAELAQQAEALLAHCALEHKLYVVGGGYPFPATTSKVFNRLSVFNPKGEIIFHYDKTHLFDVEVAGICYQESKTTAVGSQPAEGFAVKEFWLNVAICYDLRFPELFRRGMADVWLLPAAFTRVTGEAHWEILLRARAIENQCYVVAAAQYGSHPGQRQTFGHSMIVNPWGTILAQLPYGEGYVVSEIDKGELWRIRQQLPALKHRRF